MKLDIKFRSITTRWILNVFVIVASTVTVAVVAFSLFFSSLYTERISTLMEDYSQDFATLSSTNPSSFEDAAVLLSDSFMYKDKIEVQVLNTSGKVIVSTAGFLPEEDYVSEYEAAMSASKGVNAFNGKVSSGEHILAITHIIKDSESNPLGAYRTVTSLAAAVSKIRVLVLILVLIGVGIIGFCGISGLYFIKSIVNPIKNVSNMARKIAMGDFETRINSSKNDEIGELCDTINYMASELSEAETIKNDFISSVSHELRTPLTAIRGWGETARSAVGSDDELVSRGIDVVLSEADRLSNLVEDLLDFSRMQSGRLTFDQQPIDVTALLKNAVDMYTELAKKQSIEVSFAPPAAPAVVMGDGDRLKQVFINVIDNAVKYTEKGGLILVTQVIEDDCVRILIKDTGVGIPATDIDRVKEKFFKSNKTVRGSGIGLAVADEIIKQHQGLLFLESTEGVGTTVTVVLPLTTEPLYDTLGGEENVEPIGEITEEIAERSVDDMIEPSESEDKGEENG